MCRLDSSDDNIIKDILATSLRFSSRIRQHWMLYINTTDYIQCVQLHVMLDDIMDVRLSYTIC